MGQGLKASASGSHLPCLAKEREELLELTAAVLHSHGKAMRASMKGKKLLERNQVLEDIVKP